MGAVTLHIAAGFVALRRDGRRNRSNPRITAKGWGDGRDRIGCGADGSATLRPERWGHSGTDSKLPQPENNRAVSFRPAAEEAGARTR
jgi:hypothetical protein